MSDLITILGGRGMLGSDLAPCLELAGYRVRVADLPECDITRPAHLAHALQDASVVVNCAAFTAVDKAETVPDLVRAVNATAPGTLGRLARERSLFVIHISTDYVFDGAGNQPYAETDAPRPLSVYGLTKLEGEQLLQASGAAHAILRLQWSYGQHGTNFIAKIIARARTSAELTVVSDQVGAPTWTGDIAQAIRCLVRDRRAGLYHFASAGYASRFDVARFIATQLKLPVKITPCASSAFSTPAARPQNSRFNTAKIQAVLDFTIRPWQEALAEFLKINPFSA